MKGIELSREYYRQVGIPAIRSAFPDAAGRIAAGLVGYGSECFGFDDEISGDHDFGPGFCVWLSDDDYLKYGEELRGLYESLPKRFMGYERNETPEGRGRVGIHSVRGFYEGMLGKNIFSGDPVRMFFARESSLAAATNGEVFEDPCGEFTRIRNKLLEYYPRDVQLKKMAAKAALIAQAGQYNFKRCLQRGETVAARIALDEFIKSYISMIYLINRRYMPFYKWMFRGMRELECPDGSVRVIRELADGAISRDDCDKVEMLCRKLIQFLKEKGFTGSGSDFLMDHAHELMAGIGDPRIRAIPLMEG